ncbi:MAG: isoprenylcysteine carboxylmethyltransferase family protein [Clostridia bacterium]|jgi:protein-S-isoprenylcysteine O-methyltransferase Ste14|nr:isoprenylcysteine carboxylmethyltransferase family protein [Clostridia bacterium]
MKNYVKEGQKLPLYGVGPYIVYGMAAVTAVGIVLFSYVFRIGTLSAPWTYIFRITGGFLIVFGAIVWFIGAMRSGMDENIAENKLKTDGIYAWVRNPMYSGWWFMITGISLMWVNVWILITPFINWLIMTIVLKRTEEKWLLDLYGDEYVKYLRRVNRCIPWKR